VVYVFTVQTALALLLLLLYLVSLNFDLRPWPSVWPRQVNVK